jgi:ABC-type sugar transport system substrate-binding protein
MKRKFAFVLAVLLTALVLSPGTSAAGETCWYGFADPIRYYNFDDIPHVDFTVGIVPPRPQRGWTETQHHGIVAVLATYGEWYHNVWAFQAPKNSKFLREANSGIVDTYINCD